MTNDEKLKKCLEFIKEQSCLGDLDFHLQIAAKGPDYQDAEKAQRAILTRKFLKTIGEI